MKEFNSVNEVANLYGLQSVNLITLIKTGQVHRDGGTCFEYLLNHQISK